MAFVKREGKGGSDFFAQCINYILGFINGQCYIRAQVVPWVMTQVQGIYFTLMTTLIQTMYMKHQGSLWGQTYLIIHSLDPN